MAAAIKTVSPGRGRPTPSSATMLPIAQYPYVAIRWVNIVTRFHTYQCFISDIADKDSLSRCNRHVCFGPIADISQLGHKVRPPHGGLSEIRSGVLIRRVRSLPPPRQ